MIIWCVCVFLCPLIHSLTHMVLHVGCSIPYLPNIHIECIKLALVAFEFRFAFALCVTCTQFYRISASTKKQRQRTTLEKTLVVCLYSFHAMNQLYRRLRHSRDLYLFYIQVCAQVNFCMAACHCIALYVVYICEHVLFAFKTCQFNILL